MRLIILRYPVRSLATLHLTVGTARLPVGCARAEHPAAHHGPAAVPGRGRAAASSACTRTPCSRWAPRRGACCSSPAPGRPAPWPPCSTRPRTRAGSRATSSSSPTSASLLGTPVSVTLAVEAAAGRVHADRGRRGHAGRSAGGRTRRPARQGGDRRRPGLDAGAGLPRPRRTSTTTTGCCSSPACTGHSGPAATTALLTVVTVDPPRRRSRWSTPRPRSAGTAGRHPSSTLAGRAGAALSGLAGPAPPLRSPTSCRPAPPSTPTCAGRLDLAFRRPACRASWVAPPSSASCSSARLARARRRWSTRRPRAVGAQLVRLWGPGLASASDAAAQLQAGRRAGDRPRCPASSWSTTSTLPCPREGQALLLGPLVDTIRMLLATGRVAVIGTSSKPQDVNPAVVAPGLLSHEIALPLPSRDVRRRVLAPDHGRCPSAADVDFDDIAGRTPGFVAADLVSLCREAAVRAAHRHGRSRRSRP